jgi:hypothetical protein
VVDFLQAFRAGTPHVCKEPRQRCTILVPPSHAVELQLCARQRTVEVMHQTESGPATSKWESRVADAEADVARSDTPGKMVCDSVKAPGKSKTVLLQHPDA